jgi:hypothetical protein
MSGSVAHGLPTGEHFTMVRAWGKAAPPPLVFCAENTIRHRSQIERRIPGPSPRTLNHRSGMPRRLSQNTCPIC